MTFEEIKALDHQYVMQSYGRFDVAVDHGRGATLWDTAGPGIHRLHLRHRRVLPGLRRRGLGERHHRAGRQAGTHLQSVLR